MAISPPGDILMDVVRAADPVQVAQAREKLAAARATTVAEASTPFETGRVASGKKVPESFVKFESMVLQSFVQAMLPKDAEQVYGAGLAGDMWKGMMAEQIAGAIARGGGIGIAEKVLKSHTIDDEGNKTAVTGVVDADIGAKDHQMLMSDALIGQFQTKIMRSFDDRRDDNTTNITSRKAT